MRRDTVGLIECPWIIRVTPKVKFFRGTDHVAPIVSWSKKHGIHKGKARDATLLQLVNQEQCTSVRNTFQS